MTSGNGTKIAKRNVHFRHKQSPRKYCGALAMMAVSLSVSYIRISTIILERTIRASKPYSICDIMREINCSYEAYYTKNGQYFCRILTFSQFSSDYNYIYEAYERLPFLWPFKVPVRYHIMS